MNVTKEKTQNFRHLEDYFNLLTVSNFNRDIFSQLLLLFVLQKHFLQLNKLKIIAVNTFSVRLIRSPSQKILTSADERSKRTMGGPSDSVMTAFENRHNKRPEIALYHPQQKNGRKCGSHMLLWVLHFYHLFKALCGYECQSEILTSRQTSYSSLAPSIWGLSWCVPTAVRGKTLPFYSDVSIIEVDGFSSFYIAQKARAWQMRETAQRNCHSLGA